VTTPGTTDDLASAAEETTASAALAAGLDALTHLHDDALARIAHLADTWDQPQDDVRVLRRAELPTVAHRVEAAAA
jgi:hypothetical protein